MTAASDIVIYIPDDGEPTPEQIIKLRRLQAINESDDVIDGWLKHREAACACKNQSTDDLATILTVVE